MNGGGEVGIVFDRITCEYPSLAILGLFSLWNTLTFFLPTLYCPVDLYSYNMERHQPTIVVQFSLSTSVSYSSASWNIFHFHSPKAIGHSVHSQSNSRISTGMVSYRVLHNVPITQLQPTATTLPIPLQHGSPSESWSPTVQQCYTHRRCVVQNNYEHGKYASGK